MEKHSQYDCPCLERCPLHEAMRCIGGKWKAQILCALKQASACPAAKSAFGRAFFAFWREIVKNK